MGRILWERRLFSFLGYINISIQKSQFFLVFVLLCQLFCKLCKQDHLTNVSSLSSFATPAYKSKKDKYARRNKDIQLPIYPKSILSIFSDDLPTEWLLEGITEESMVKYDIKYSISQNKIIIPHYNTNGELIGIRGRAC